MREPRHTNHIKVAITVPLSVWYDALDPNTSTIEVELGLPRPSFVKIGKGGRMVYSDVQGDVADELADYLIDRGATILNNTNDERDKGIQRRAIEAGARIRAVVEKERHR